jgi:hypothetical protein
LLANELTHFEDDGALVLDNRAGANWVSSQTEFFSVPGPFRLVVAFEGSPDIEPVFLDGNPRGANWWDGEILYLGENAMRLFDGRASSGEAFDWYFLGGKGRMAVKFEFGEPCQAFAFVEKGSSTLNLESPACPRF